MRRLHIIRKDNVFGDFGFFYFPVLGFFLGEPLGDLNCQISLAGADLVEGILENLLEV